MEEGKTTWKRDMEKGERTSRGEEDVEEGERAWEGEKGER